MCLPCKEMGRTSKAMTPVSDHEDTMSTVAYCRKLQEGCSDLAAKQVRERVTEQRDNTYILVSTGLHKLRLEESRRKESGGLLNNSLRCIHLFQKNRSSAYTTISDCDSWKTNSAATYHLPKPLIRISFLVFPLRLQASSQVPAVAE